MSVNSRVKASKIIGQGKAFYRQRILGSSCARKETVDIDILVASRNGDRKVMQSIRITSTITSLERVEVKFERKLQLLVKLSFREFCDSKLSGLYPFDNMVIIN